MGAPVGSTKEDVTPGRWPEVKIPRPFPGGSYSVESMGRWVDRLLGDHRAQQEADSLLEPFLMREEDMPPDPEPVDVPDAVPGGTEPITKDADPSEEKRG